MMLLALEGGTTLSTVITADMLQGVLNEMLGVLPVCIPVMISFIGIRKGIAFVRWRTPTTSGCILLTIPKRCSMATR